MSSSLKTKNILSQQKVESLVSSGVQKAIKETGQGGEVTELINSRWGMGRVSEKEPVSTRFDAIMVPFGWALRAFLSFKDAFGLKITTTYLYSWSFIFVAYWCVHYGSLW